MVVRTIRANKLRTLQILIVIALLSIPFVLAATVSHLPSQLVPGSFQQGNYTFQNYTIALEGMCIGSSCRASWPSGGSGWDITTSSYLYNNSGILEVNETKLNVTIDARGTGIWTNQSGTAYYPDDIKLDGTILLKNMSTPSADSGYAKLYYRESQNTTSTTSTTGGNDDYTVLLLHNDGDASNQNHTYTVNGTPKLNASMPANDTTAFGGSMYFDGVGDYLSIPDSSDWNLGTDNFTIDSWIRPSDVTDTQVVEQWEAGGGSDRAWQIYINASGNILFYGMNSTGTIFISLTSDISVSADTWYHIAAVRNGSIAKLYINGRESASDSTASGTISNSTVPVLVGANWLIGATNVELEFTGYIDELRISKGVARFFNDTCDGTDWSCFSKPTAPYSNPDSDTKLLLHFDGDDSNSNHTIRFNGNTTANASAPANDTAAFSGSYYFDGTDDYLSIPDSNDWDMDEVISVDFWTRISAFEFWDRLLSIQKDNDNLIQVMIPGENKLSVGAIKAASAIDQPTTSVLSTDTWYHVAFVWNGTNVSEFFLNGVKQTDTIVNAPGADADGAQIKIGTRTASYFNGYIDELRISKGIARWTGNFTVPNSPYDNSSNTTTTTTNSSKLYLLGPDGTETEIGGSSGSVSDSDWTISGENIYHETGNVGIGTTNPGQKLDVVGNVSVTNLNSQVPNQILGDGTANRVIRASNFVIQDGTNADTVKLRLRNDGGYGWNGDAIASTDNIGKGGGSTSNFELSATGEVVTIHTASTVVGVIGINVMYDSSTTLNPIFVSGYITSGHIILSFSTNTGGIADLTTITAGKEIDVLITYISSD